MVLDSLITEGGSIGAGQKKRGLWGVNQAAVWLIDYVSKVLIMRDLCKLYLHKLRMNIA